MADRASRRGAADLGLPLMILAFLVMGGFLYWLYGQAKAEEAAQAQMLEEQMAAEADTIDASGATIIAAADIQMDATPYEGQLLRLDGVNVASQLGTQGFWLEMPNGNPFLVSMSDEVMAQGLTITMGQPVTVIGTMTPMTPEVAQSWLDAGTIGDGDKLAAEFATHYIDAQTVRGPGASGGGDGGGAGAGGN